MAYPEAIKYLESFIDYEKIPLYPYKESLKLERIKDFLGLIGNPQDNLSCIHIAGTKGKGSTSAFITYILREAGYKVGLYTSPHLSDFRERIRILNPKSLLCRPAGKTQKINDFEGVISRKDLTGLVEKIKPAISKFNKDSRYGALSFFEVYTALAFLYFKEKKVDFAVLETGLGGRLDATNVSKPLVCAITPISYEHTQKLGKTLRKIATEKAGIIKCRRIVVSAPQKKEVMDVIKKRCRESKAELRGINHDKYKIRLLGRHQQINANVAVAVIKALSNYKINVTKGIIKKGLYNTIWPGRCEVIAKNPFVVLDGAQNVASAQVLKEAIKENFSAGSGSACGGQYKDLILVLGISQDKDIQGICRELSGLADKVILTKSHNPRATLPCDLTGYFNGKETYITDNVDEARELAKRLSSREDLILVTGSLFVVGEYRDGEK